MPACPRALWRDAELPRDAAAPRPARWSWSSRGRSRFDVIHFHCDYLHFPLVRRLPCPSVTTLHGRLHPPDLEPLFDAYPEVPLVSISDDQRRPIPRCQLAGDGLPRAAARPAHVPRAAGRLPRLPRPHVAREAAGPGHRDRPAGRHAAEGRRQDLPGGARLLTSEMIEPLFRAVAPWVEFVGEVGGRERTSSWATPTPCCSRSTGRSRSAW